MSEENKFLSSCVRKRVSEAEKNSEAEEREVLQTIEIGRYFSSDIEPMAIIFLQYVI